MSKSAQRLRRVGASRATVRHNLNAKDAATDARRYGPHVAKFAR
jgi:hypothetical protein